MQDKNPNRAPEIDWLSFQSLVDSESHPNFNPLSFRLKDMENLALNIKFFGYELARRMAENLPVRDGLAFAPIDLRSKASTQIDLESDWVAYWCGELAIPVVFHRKLWELAYVLQTLRQSGALTENARGVGFGCGEEPIASYLASKGVQIVVTDLNPDDEVAKEWRDTAQHTTNRDRAFKPHLVDRETFDAKVSHRFVDMNDIPSDLADFDFCWSICSLEHLGTIEKGMNFVRNSLHSLKPGGVAVHTTEFNFLYEDQTIDNWPTVLPLRKHFLALAEALRNDGHTVAPLDFDIGRKPLDRFIDIPPYPHDPKGTIERFGAEQDSNHLKMSIDGFPSTCFGIIVTKAR